MPPDGNLDKEPDVSTKRASTMSYEDPMSPISPSNSNDDDDAISEASTEDDNYEEDDQRRHPEKRLTPHISRASSTNAVGGVFVDVDLDRVKSSATTTTQDPRFEVDFEPNDPQNPKCWKLWFRVLTLFVMSYNTTAVVLYSTSYTTGIPGMISDWGISDTEGNLGLTTYLLGMAVGSVILAPLSEMYGRRPIYIVALALFVVLVLPCALAQNIGTVLAVRFLAAFCASAMIGNAPGSINDIADEAYRTLAFSVWSIGPMNGPILGPVVGGFTFQYLGWRWTNWVVMIASGLAFVLVLFIPETYAPAILRKRAARMRKKHDDNRYWSRYDEKKAFLPLLKLNLWRPFKLVITEPICIFWDIYIAVIYGILYLCFVAYPIVFNEARGWSPGLGGLAFSGIGVGSLIVICAEPLIRKWINAHKPDPETGLPPPEASISIICVAAVLMPAGEIWFAWTCTPDVHWIWPILAGIPFGGGTGAIFIYASNYLVHSYGIYAASALAGNAVTRSIMGATLPLAGPAMYRTLGSNWAGTVLGLIEAILIPIPFVFYKYGDRIRKKSALIRSMQEDKARMEAKRSKAGAEIERRAEAEVAEGAGMMGTGAVIEESIDIEKGQKH